MAGRFLFDVSGLLLWYAYFQHPSGIERITQHLLTAKPIQDYARTEFVARALGSDVLYAVDRAVLDDLCDSVRRPSAIARLRGIFAQSIRFASPGRLRRELWRFHIPYVIGGALRLEAVVEALFARRLPRLTAPLRIIQAPDARDAFFNPGNFWCHDGYVESIVETKRQTGMRLVQLVHDLFWIDHPDWRHPRFGHVVVGGFEHLAPHVDGWLATSRFVHDRLKDYVVAQKLQGRPMDILPMGWQSFGQTAVTAEPDRGSRVLSKYGLADKKYVLHVGTVEPRKNLMALIDAMSDLRKLAPAAVPYCVLVGREGWQSEHIRRRLSSTRFEDGTVVWLKNVSDSELPALYRGAEFAVVPSSTEGWGLPIRESLEHGLPCITSRSGGMEEAGQELAAYFDPDDPDGLKAALWNWIGNEEVLRHARARIAVHFKSKANHLSWDDAGAAVLRASLETV